MSNNTTFLNKNSTNARNMITREKFEQAISPLVNKTINIVTRTISDIDLKIDDIKGVILVGSATRIPLVQNSLFKLFGNKVLTRERIQVSPPPDFDKFWICCKATKTKGHVFFLYRPEAMSKGRNNPSKRR